MAPDADWPKGGVELGCAGCRGGIPGACRGIGGSEGVSTMRIYTSQQISAMLEGDFKRNVHRDTLVLDNVPYAVAVGSDRPEAEQSKRWVSAIRRREDGSVEDVPPVVREDRGQWRLVASAAHAGGDARR